MTNAFSLMAMHTSLKGTSLVRVYPCKTLGSALVIVEADVHGVGISSDSCFMVSSGESKAASSFECLKEDNA